MADGLIASLTAKFRDLILPEMELKKFEVKNFTVKEFPTWSIVDIVFGSEHFRIYPNDFSGEFEDAITELKRLETSPAGIDIVVDVTRSVRGTRGAVIRARDLSGPRTVMQAKFISFQGAGADGDKKYD